MLEPGECREEVLLSRQLGVACQGQDAEVSLRRELFEGSVTNAGDRVNQAAARDLASAGR